MADYSNYVDIARELLRRPAVRSLCVKLPFSTADGRRTGEYESLILRSADSQGTDLTSTQVKGRYLQFMLLWQRNAVSPSAYENVVYQGLTYQVQEVRAVSAGSEIIAWNVLATID